MKLRDEATFWAEYQNEPLVEAQGETETLDADEVAGKTNGRRRREVPVRCEHLTAEHRVRTEGRGRTVDEWRLPAHKPDNHWLDCLVGCAAAASIQGVERIGAAAQPRVERKRLKLSELRRRRH